MYASELQVRPPAAGPKQLLVSQPLANDLCIDLMARRSPGGPLGWQITTL